MKLTDGSYVYEGLGEKIVQILVESLAWRLQLDIDVKNQQKNDD